MKALSSLQESAVIFLWFWPVSGKVYCIISCCPKNSEFCGMGTFGGDLTVDHHRRKESLLWIAMMR